MNVERLSGEEKRFYRRILRETIQHTIVYFDIFKYPLKIDEIIAFMGIGGFSRFEVEEELEDLASRQLVFRVNEFYGLHAGNENVSRRLKGNEEAVKQMPAAKKWARIIACFPFVRGVLISGSLSKGYMDENSDLDFFIITASGRLWITRMLLVVFKRVALFNSHKNFCVNYFVDDESPVIAEQNIFTATELSTLIPLYGDNEYHKLVRSNRWMLEYLPNWTSKLLTDVPASESKGLKRFFESILNCCSPERLDNLFRRLTTQRWHRLYQKEYSRNDFDVVFKSSDRVSKNHPRNFQKKVLTIYQQRIDAVDQQLGDTYSAPIVKSAV